MRALSCAACAALVFVLGCASRNPEWAESVNPCCGQDELLEGVDASEQRCADLIVSSSAALEIAWRVAAGGGGSQWRVRLLPGGPACIWKLWPGLTEDDFDCVERVGEAEPDVRSSAAVDSGRVREPARSASDSR